jgi:hypothetical protein
MRRMLSLGLCLASLCALSALAAPGALANVLTLKTAAGAIPSGGELKATSSNLTFKSGAIKIECASAEESGKLVVNGATATKGNFTSFKASGCKTSGGAATLVACSVEWPTSLAEQIAKFGEKRTGSGKKTVCLEATTVEGGNCKYNAAEIASRFNIGGPEKVTTEEQEFGALGCKESKESGAPGILSETQTLTSNGETVEVVSSPAPGSEPGWWECAKKTGSVFQKGCRATGGKAGYELQPGLGKGKAFKGKGGEAKLHTSIPGKGDIPVECEKFKDEGHAALPNLQVKVKATFSKCKFAGLPCQSGTKKGTIETNSLAGELGYVSKSPLKVGASLYAESEPGAGLEAEFTCTGAAKIRVHGGVIGTQTGDINTFSKSSTTTYVLTEAELIPGFKSKINEDEKFEGGPFTVLLSEFEQGKGFEPEGGLPSGQEGSAENKGEELAVKA